MSLINPSDTLERQNQKLLRIAEALMRRVEEKSSDSGLAYAQFERAALLEGQVRRRTEDLGRALDLLHESNAQLTEAKRQAEAARSDLADAIETIDGGFCLFGPDDRLVMNNSRFCGALEDVRARIRPGMKFAEYVEAVSQSAHLSLAGTETAASWRSRRLARHEDDVATFNVRLAGDRWIQVSEHRTASGGTVILQTDVTELMRSEREARDRLRDSQARMLRATLDHLEQGVCIFDARRQLAGWNRRLGELFDLQGVTREDVLALPFAAFVRHLGREFSFTGAFDARQLLAWGSRAAGRTPLNFEVRQGPDRTLKVFAQEMPDHGFVISFTDVSVERNATRALAQLNEQLEQRVEERTLELGDALAAAERANASKSRFVAAASHDLLQPLSAAKLLIESLTDHTDPSAAEVAGMASNALAGAEQIIAALLDISRLDIGEAAFSVRPISVEALLRTLEQELKPMADAKGLSLRFVGSSVNVLSDATYLRRIVQNLAVNAVRYTESGRVLVGVRRQGGMARIEVRDTGPGIAESDQKLIFQEFKQLAPGRHASGLGLGLAIVERACASLGHQLDLESTPGRGSCFAVTLPIGPDDGPALSASPHQVRTPTDLSGMVVLVVEDDPLLFRAMSMMVEGWGGDVIGASSGEEALALLDEIDLAPDAALLDNHLGEGMNGTELYRALRARFGALPARILSADRTTTLAEACAALDLGLLNKPVDRAVLAQFLHGCRPPRPLGP